MYRYDWCIFLSKLARFIKCIVFLPPVTHQLTAQVQCTSVNGALSQVCLQFNFEYRRQSSLSSTLSSFLLLSLLLSAINKFQPRNKTEFDLFRSEEVAANVMEKRKQRILETKWKTFNLTRCGAIWYFRLVSFALDSMQ